MRESEMRQIASWITDALEHRTDPAALARIRAQVLELADQFPLYSWLREPVHATV